MKVVTVVALIAVFVLALGLPAFADQPARAGRVDGTAARWTLLEKQNLVLSEDLGKAQLQNRQLEEAARAQAAAIAQLNQQLAAEQKKAQEERDKQAKRNQYTWIAVGLVAAIALGR